MKLNARRYGQFLSNIGRASELIGLGQSIAGMTFGRVDAADMYRAAVVQAVAALDSYAHGVVLDYGVDILVGRRSPGSTTQIGLHFGAVSDLIRSRTEIDFELRVRTYVAERLTRETFQKPDDIARAFAMVGISKIWSSAFGNEANAMKTSVSLAVHRRNQIVHGCDVDPLAPSQVVPLADRDALSVIDVIRKVVRGLDVVI